MTPQWISPCPWWGWSRILVQVSRIVFATLQCDELVGIGKFLTVDYRVSCLDDNYKIYRTYAYVAILIWPVGVPVLCIAMLRYYEVPKLAAQKIKRAEELAFLQRWTSELARQSRPLGELTQLQLYQLLQSTMSSDTASNEHDTLELDAIDTSEIFNQVFTSTDAPQSCAERPSSEPPLPPQLSGCSQLSMSLPAEQATSTSLAHTGQQVGTIFTPLEHRYLIDYVVGCSRLTHLAILKPQITCQAKTSFYQSFKC